MLLTYSQSQSLPLYQLLVLLIIVLECLQLHVFVGLLYSKKGIVISCLGTAGILGIMGCAWRAFCPLNGMCFCDVMFNSHTCLLVITVFTCIAFCINLQVFSLNPKAMVHFQLLLRLVKSIALLVVLAGLIVAIVSTSLSFADVLASILAYVPTGWGILSVSFMWQLWYHAAFRKPCHCSKRHWIIKASWSLCNLKLRSGSANVA